LAPVLGDYDFIILDCPPAISMVTANAFVASQKLIIPTECKAYSFIGISELKKNIDEIKAALNPGLEVLGILLVKYDRRTQVTRQLQSMIGEFAGQLHTTVYDATIRNGVAVEEAALTQTPLCDYVRRHNQKPYIDYKAFVTETLKRLGMETHGD
ncbi:MAG: ParA family protein, partial [Ruminococcus flavefaciens]|nr:ParA family protein [Ruminococcus flavefaciens]